MIKVNTKARDNVLQEAFNTIIKKAQEMADFGSTSGRIQFRLSPHSQAALSDLLEKEGIKCCERGFATDGTDERGLMRCDVLYTWG